MTGKTLQWLENLRRRQIEVKKWWDPEFYGTSVDGCFPFVPPIRYEPPVKEHVQLHLKSLCLVNANNILSLTLWGHKWNRSRLKSAHLLWLSVTTLHSILN